MTIAPRRAVRRFLGFVCLLVVVTSVLGLLGGPPTRRWAPDSGIASMWIGLAVSLIASLAGGLPVFMADLRRGAMQSQHTLLSLVVRFLAVLLGIGYVLLSGFTAPSHAPFLIWVGIGYLLLLPIDVFYQVMKLNQTVDSTGPNSRASAER